MRRATAGASPLARLMERVLAGLALLLLAPLLAAIALAIRFDSRGPVLYRETRLGQRGRPLVVVKFRTLSATGAGGRRVVAADDPGVTRVGRLLRRRHLDELPQLVAVVRGDMGLVGPRPERADIWATIEPGLRTRALDLRPGMISPAGLRYLCEDTVLAEFADRERLYREVLVPTKLREDLHYFDTRTPSADLRLLARTLWRILFVRGVDPRCSARVRALIAAVPAASRAGAAADRRG